MSVKIRLSRLGRKNVPYYHIVVADSKSPRDGKFIEQVGTYNPLIKEGPCVSLKKERIDYWLSVGGEPTKRMAILLKKENINLPERFESLIYKKASDK